MLKFENENTHIFYPWKVIFQWEGQNVEENWALPDKEWWVETSNKHKDLKIINFVEFILNKHQKKRYEEVKDFIVEGYCFEEYILEGQFPKNLLFNKEDVTLEDVLESIKNA